MDLGTAKDAFLSYLRTERRSPDNTLMAYERDLGALESYLAEKKQTTLEGVNVYGLRAFLADRSKTLAPASRWPMAPSARAAAARIDQSL